MAMTATNHDSPRLRWLLLVSIGLNLAFVGAAGAVAIRYTSPVPLRPVARLDNSMAGRIDRIASRLPPDDAEIIKSELRADSVSVAAVQADLRLSQDAVRKSLRAQPFDPEAMQAAMTENRMARQRADGLLHDMIVAAATKMSDAGRNKLADGPPDKYQPVTP
jgi:uncharacterized membrane protein